MQIDGAIARDVKMAENLARSDFPVIFAQHSRESYGRFPAIITDSSSIGQKGVEHFLNRGFQNFAYCGLDDFIWSRERGQFFKKRVEQEGLNVYFYKQPKSKTKRLWKNEQYLLIDWLKSLPKPIAVMCCNDDRALHIIEACKLTNLYVPDEVAVFGVDNDALVCELAEPPISSIAPSTEAAGYQAAELLDRLMKGEKVSSQIIKVSPTYIATRLSTDILAITDPEVTTAVRFIRDNANRFIQVGDVVEATALSRRVLESRFRTILRRSIHQEIRRFRVNHIIQLLLGTNLTVTEIALRSGFNGVEHISRYFRKQTDTSLRDYRKKYTP